MELPKAPGVILVRLQNVLILCERHEVSTVNLTEHLNNNKYNSEYAIGSGYIVKEMHHLDRVCEVNYLHKFHTHSLSPLARDTYPLFVALALFHSKDSDC